MGQILGQQVVIENKLGAGSSIAGAQAARSPKDGYTLFVGSAANVINAAMTSNLNFDFYKDFAPIALITSTPTVLAVTPELGVKSVKELIAYAKANPGKLSFGSSGVGSSTHLALELFNSLANVKITHIPYSGSPQVVTDLLAGRIHGYFSPASSVSGHFPTGKLVPRSPSPTPSAARSFPRTSDDGRSRCARTASPVLWFGIEAPIGTPQPIIDKLNRAANEAMKSDEGREFAEEDRPWRSLAARRRISHATSKAERKRWTAVVEAAGLRK